MADESYEKYLQERRRELLELSPEVRQALVLLHPHRLKAIKGVGHRDCNRCVLAWVYGCVIESWERLDPHMQRRMYRDGWTVYIFNAFIRWHDLEDIVRNSPIAVRTDQIEKHRYGLLRGYFYEPTDLLAARPSRVRGDFFEVKNTGRISSAPALVLLFAPFCSEKG